MKNKDRKRWLNRRQFMETIAAAAIGVTTKRIAVGENLNPRNVFLVPNFHGSSCGWLTTFSKERVYTANSYLDHLDRVRDDPRYAFVMSEVNNFIAIMNFQPQRVPELKQRIQEKRVELVNSFFLESTVNLSGGEALVRQGVEGLRWYEQVLGVRPKYAWMIDICGAHDQMAQISSGLGLEAMLYCRRNPTGKSIYWSVSPDGSRILTFCPGAYNEAPSLFSTKTPLTPEGLNTLEELFESKEAITPDGAPILVLAGNDDYSLAPAVKKYPSEFLDQWAKTEYKRIIEFATLSDYVDSVLPGIQSGSIRIPTFAGGTAYDFDSMWIENPTTKSWYRRDEHALQAAEALATVASLTTDYKYPAKALNDAWVLMCLNMDRGTLWGNCAGVVFVSEQSWDAKDRYEWVQKTADRTLESSGNALLPEGEEIGLFNPLNWKRNDPVELRLPAGTSLEGVRCESLPNGSTLCEIEMPSVSVGVWKLARRPSAAPRTVDLTETLETNYYSFSIDRHTGALTSLKLKKTGRELLAGPSNVIVAERPIDKGAILDSQDHMVPRPDRTRLATSSDQPTTVQVSKGPVALTVEARGTFYGGGSLRRVVRFYHKSSRIDFETELNDVPNFTVVVSEFCLASDILEVRRGIPFGFSHGSWSNSTFQPEEKEWFEKLSPKVRIPSRSMANPIQLTYPNPHGGWTKGIVPAIRWIDYALADGGGFAMMDRGLTGRELNQRTPLIYLLSAIDKYHGFESAWLSGKGRHLLPYSIMAYDGTWEHARIPQMAWEYNRSPVVIPDRAVTQTHSFLETSGNIIVEALRREGNHIELRLVECFGLSGKATVKLSLPHHSATFTDLMGRKQSVLGGSSPYEFIIRPQQIVTMHFETSSTLPIPEPITAWDPFVSQEKLAALHQYDPNLKGHPPFGE